MLSTCKKMMLLIVIILIPALLFPQEGNVLKKILKSGELRIGTSGSQPPFTMKPKMGN